MTSSGLQFAQLELEKYGWKEGKGLGREESGMTEAIKPKLKFDSSGLGHDIAEEFKCHWWDHVFNETAANISVDKTQDGSVQLSRKKDVIHLNKKKSSMNNKAKLYGSFVEGGILNGGNEEKEKSESEESEHEQKFSHTLTDEELFKICGGRTAHKGARHGLNMSAKLARSEELERLWMQKWATSDEQAQQEPVEGETKERKKRKKQKQNRGEDISEIDTTFDVKLTKEKVHKNENINFITKDLEQSGMSNKLKKRKRNSGSALESPLEVVKNESSNDHNCSEELTNEDIEQPESQDIEMNRCKRKEKKKEKKNKETAVDDTNECVGDGKEMKKKKRKKVKCAGRKENSCTEVEEQEAKIVKEEIEVNQVCSESETTEPKKKKKLKHKDNDDKVQHTEGNNDVVQVIQKKKKKKKRQT